MCQGIPLSIGTMHQLPFMPVEKKPNGRVHLKSNPSSCTLTARLKNGTNLNCAVLILALPPLPVPTVHEQSQKVEGMWAPFNC